MMKKQAIRANLGDWIYYVATLTFSEVATFVSPIDDNLHKSKTLNEMLQRNLTPNAESIKTYIINQEERFFNALVLAVYDGAPNWNEVKLDFDDDGTFYELGLLKFSGEEKIFPVDGQHRVEGIKRALLENPELSNEKIPVIFIAHKTSKEGMQRSRRLFSTLNRYAKPVSKSDIIALDEDDSVAIATRELMMTLPLFEDNRIINAKQKAIPHTNKDAFTNIISLYECNIELLKLFLRKQGKSDSAADLNDYFRFRRSESELNQYRELVFAFWNSFSRKIGVIAEFLSRTIGENPVGDLRHIGGGHLLFRPAGQRPFISAAIGLYQTNGESWDLAFESLNQINLEITELPWKNVLWDEGTGKMRSLNKSETQLVKVLISYLAGQELVSGDEKRKMLADYKGLQRYDKTLLEVEEELNTFTIWANNE